MPIQTMSALSFPRLSGGGQWMAMKHLMKDIDTFCTIVKGFIEENL
jgi:hypothetical protein